MSSSRLILWLCFWIAVSSQEAFKLDLTSDHEIMPNVDDLFLFLKNPLEKQQKEQACQRRVMGAVCALIAEIPAGCEVCENFS